MKYLSSIFKILALPVLLLACSRSVETFDKEPYIVGTITEIEKEQILVEQDTSVYGPSKDGGKKVFLSISDETIILNQDADGSLSKVKNPKFEAGSEVKVWVNEPILLSYPAQAGAKRIVLLQ